ncbi:MAG: N-acetyl-gamma-glutamyl-phosphate reductase [Deltaproteobacteria bacterium]|nr:N-acetyl-gamma-glutamyl-phosphate reductase [Deltaproteobacteria bacterium]
MLFQVLIDGQEGTTGLKIHERLRSRPDIHLLEIPPPDRKNPEAKKKLLNQADVVILCLPDPAAREAVGLIHHERTKIIDASTAFRTAAGWTYGLPELNPRQRDCIRASSRLSNPGCHATGFILALHPLIQGKVVPPDYPVVSHAVTGYSGGGKKLIGVYESNAAADRLQPPRHYALGLNHKHLPEMQKFTGLSHPPLFTPIVGRFYQGLVVSIPLILSRLAKKVTPREIRDMLDDYYRGEPFIRVMPLASDSFLDQGFLSPTECNHTNRVDLFVFGHEEQALVMARLDNLGKGASGAAVQNLNLMLGLEEGLGLEALPHSP